MQERLAADSRRLRRGKSTNEEDFKSLEQYVIENSRSRTSPSGKPEKNSRLGDLRVVPGRPRLSRDAVVRYLIFLARMLLYGAVRQIETDKLGARRRTRRAGAGLRKSWRGVSDEDRCQHVGMDVAIQHEGVPPHPQGERDGVRRSGGRARGRL